MVDLPPPQNNEGVDHLPPSRSVHQKESSPPSSEPWSQFYSTADPSCNDETFSEYVGRVREEMIDLGKDFPYLQSVKVQTLSTMEAKSGTGSRNPRRGHIAVEEWPPSL